MIVRPNGVALQRPAPIRIAIGMLAYGGQIDADHAPAAFLLGSVCGANHVLQQTGAPDQPPPIAFVGYAVQRSQPVSHARNLLVAWARAAGAQWLLMLDADTYTLDAGALIAMIVSGHVSDAAAIAAPVLMRNRRGHNVWMDDERLARPEEFAGRRVKVRRIGAACMAVNISWIARHWRQQPWFEMPAERGAEPSVVGEDRWFCDGVIERGGDVWCDGRFEPEHRGARELQIAMAVAQQHHEAAANG